jgi:hypothetical protein
MNDLDIDRWSEIYIANPALRVRGLTLTQFLADPEARLSESAFGTVAPLPADEEFYPLLSVQRRVAARVAAAESFAVVAEQVEAELTVHVECRHAGDHYMEPLRHHTYEINRARMRRVL